MTSSLKITDLDEWSESSFSRLCAFAGVTRNKAVQDRTGWDYLIEYPPKVIPRLPADLQPTGHSARVQVKSKGKGRPATSVKLSNALRFAKDPTACFVVLFLATDGCEPVRIFARHVWDDLIAETLKRARLAESEARTDMRRLRLPITFSDTDEHTEDLVPWMQAQIEAVGGLYAEKKNRILQTIGMEDGGIHGTITFAKMDWDALVAHQIGLADHAPITNVTIRQRRFGIDAVEPLISMAPDWASVRSNPRQCKLRIRGVDGELWMPAELLMPSFPGMPTEHFRFRVKADFLHFVSAMGVGGDGSATLNCTPTDQRTLTAMRSLLDVVRMARNGPLDISIRYEGQTFFAAVCSVVIPPNMDWLDRHSDCLEMLEAVAGPDAPSDVTLSAQDIETAWNSVVDLNALVAGSDLTVSAKLAVPLDRPLVGATLVAYDYADVGKWAFMAVVARPIRSITQDGNGFSLVCGAPKVLEGFVKAGKGEASLAELVALHHAAVRASGPGTLTMFDGCFRAMVGSLTGPIE